MRLWAVCLLVGCASGQAWVAPDDGDITTPADAAADVDEIPVDARMPLDAAPDAPPDAPVDAPPDAPPDAYQCTVMTTQLLVNPVFDLDANGTGWVQQNIDDQFPIITGQDGAPEHSAPYKAWLGGFTGPGVTDMLYQDVAVPEGTTELRVTGYYWVATQEATSTFVFDTAQVGLVETDGTPIETAIELTNLTTTSTWTPINKTFAMPQAGKTVRLRFTSTNDVSNVTNFFFDTFALTATYCQ